MRGSSATATAPDRGATGNTSPARINNSIRYASPSSNGLRARVILGLGEAAGRRQRQPHHRLTSRYTKGPFDATLAYLQRQAQRHVGNIRNVGTASTADTTTVALAGSYDSTAATSFSAASCRWTTGAPKTRTRGYWLGGDSHFGSNAAPQW